MKTRNFQLWSRQIENAATLLASDALALLAALLLGNFFLYWIFDTPISIRYSIMIVPTWWTGAVIFGLVPGWGLGPIEELRRIENLLIGVFTLAAVVYFFSRELMLPSRIVYLGSYAVATLLIPFARSLTKRLLIRIGLWGAPAAIYGDADSVRGIIAAFSRDKSVGYVPAGIFSNDFRRGDTIDGVPVLGSNEQSTPELPIAIVSLSHFPERELTPFIDNELAAYHKLVLLPNIHENVFSWIIPRNFGGVVGLEVSRNLLLPLVLNIKSMFEILLILLAAPIWIPLLIIISLFILAADRDWPFFLQERIGRHGERFRTVKFRTMHRNAEAELERHLNKNPELRAQWDENFKLTDDPRTTRIGKVLRRYSLDELPQLFNVLFCEMSLVGPRPLPEYHHNALSASTHAPRYRVRPGMTGLWQVSGRSGLDLHDMEKWDTYYVRNWSIWLDLVILARTISAVFHGRGAF